MSHISPLRPLFPAALLALGVGHAHAAVDVTQFTLNELMQMEITSVAKKEQSLLDSAAAVHVITREEIRRSGLESVPELLRQVPGLQVARYNGHGWAISSRGFNSIFSNKLLVLIDGRSVYTPLFSGVYWDVQGPLLEEVERIEVIRGPGGTLWGANAVNGVINIITRHARDSRGTLARAGVGGEGGGSIALRHGGRLGESGDFRVHLQGEGGDGEVHYPNDAPHDGWQRLHAGFRADLAPSSRDTLMIQGELYDGEFGDREFITDPFVPGTRQIAQNDQVNGAHLLALWRRRDGDSDWSLQGYVDRAERDETILGQRIDTIDLDFHYRFPYGERHEVTWGLGYRRVEDRLRDSYTVDFTPERRDSELYSAFIQDAVALADDLTLTVGAKLEHNDYSGGELQPSARLLWRMDEGRALWGAVSKAVRTPSRAFHDLTIRPVVLPLGPVMQPVTISGNPDFDSEEVVSYELGWRAAPGERLNLDLAGFYNVYDNLNNHGVDPANPFLGTRHSNGLEGEGYGLEATLSWQASPTWRLDASYSWLDNQLHLKPGSGDAVREAQIEGTSPEQQFQLHSHLDLRRDLELDAYLYCVDELPALGVAGYARLDLRLGWRPNDDLELSIALRNLLDDRHPEFATNETVGGEVPRTAFAKVTWSF